MDKPMPPVAAGDGVPEINHVAASQVWTWLDRGWSDLRHAPGPSLGHGALLAGMGWTILVLCSTHVDLVAAAISGFMLVGPVFGAAFYELSRLHERGEPATFDASLDGAGRRLRSLFPLGVVLAALALVWVFVSQILFETAFGVELPDVTAHAWQTMVEWDYAGFHLIYLATGAVLAVVAFVLAAVSAPLMFERGTDLRTALLTSVRAVAVNPLAMAAWALIIAVLTVLGFATFLFGLVIVLPLLGHATWHAYRELVRQA